MIRTTISQQWKGQEAKVAGKRVTDRTAFDVGLVVEGQAKLLAPIKSGRLAGSITTQARGRGSDVEAPATAADKIAPPADDDEVLVGTATEYGPYVEHGTRHSNAQPFLRPALALARGEVLTIGMRNGRFEFKDFIE